MSDSGAGRAPQIWIASDARFRRIRAQSLAGGDFAGGNWTIRLRPMVHPKVERLYLPPLHHGDLCGGESPRYKGFMGLRRMFAGWLVVGAAVGVCAQSKPAVRAA